MKKKLLVFCGLFFYSFISIFSQTNKGAICDIDGTCTYELKPKPEYHTKSGTHIENQFKEKAIKKTACDVTVWTDGDSKNKIYKNLISYKSPVEIVKLNKKTGESQRIIRFQYVGAKDDAAVEANNDVIFVDHEFTMYLVMPEHNCHGLPTSPTRYFTCKYCGKLYKEQQFYSTKGKGSYLNINIGAKKCNSNKSTTGNCNDLDLDDVPECPKLDEPDCDQLVKGGEINK